MTYTINAHYSSCPEIKKRKIADSLSIALHMFRRQAKVKTK